MTEEKLKSIAIRTMECNQLLKLNKDTIKRTEQSHELKNKPNKHINAKLGIFFKSHTPQ